MCIHVFQAAWQCMKRQIKRVNRHALIWWILVLLDLDETYVINSEPSIALVKSNGCDLILHSANDGVTREDLWTL